MLSKSRVALPVFFYAEDSGKEPVKEWLHELDKHARLTIGQDIKRVQIGWPIGMPLVKSLGNGLWEIRSKLDNRIARIIFLLDHGRIVLLHGFIKKTQKIPKTDIDLASKRAKKI